MASTYTAIMVLSCPNLRLEPGLAPKNALDEMIVLLIDDHHPLLNMSGLGVKCNGHGSKFSLCVAVEVFYNPLPKEEN
jgi:hypothetical protein